MDIFTILWLVWLLFFAIVEGVALVNKVQGDTLSEHVWKWFDINGKHPVGWDRLRKFTLIAFMAWLTLHFLTGGMF